MCTYKRFNKVHVRLYPDLSPLCVCLARETVSHFLLYCEIYARERGVMLRSVSHVARFPVSEALLLGSTAFRLDARAQTTIVRAVAKFVSDTRRFGG